MKKTIILGIFILLISFAYARECLDSINPSTDCQIYTPAGYDCSDSYDIVNSTGNLKVNDGSLGTLAANTGICNFTFNQPSGNYVIYLNEDNTSRVVNVDDLTKEDIISNLTSIVTDLSTVNNGISSNTTYIEGNISSVRSTQSTIITHITSLANVTLSGIWGYATRTLSAFSFSVGLNTSSLKDIDLMINDSHGVGNYNTSSSATISSNDRTLIASETNLMMNNSHGKGAYNTSGNLSISATITSGDISTIANETFNKLIQNKTETYYNTSTGYPTYEVWTYVSGGVTVNKSYNYHADGMTVLSTEFWRTP